MKRLQYMFMAMGLLLMNNTYGQLNPLGSSYFQNQYLSNPAMAGLQEGWQVNGAYKVQWTAIDGAPTLQALTATYGIPSKKIGLGLSFYNENAGVILRTGVKATYAYHVPLNDNGSFLDFGVSGGIMNEWIDLDKVVGEPDDEALHQFNRRQLYMDGDFGIAYRNERLTIQAGLPNLKRLLNRDVSNQVADRSLYMGAVSYRLGTPFLNIEPKAMYRGVENYKDIIDLGGQVGCYEDRLTMSAMYHSTGSFTLGLGTFYQRQLHILCLYTTDTSELGKHGNGEFEIGLRYQFK